MTRIRIAYKKTLYIYSRILFTLSLLILLSFISACLGSRDNPYDLNGENSSSAFIYSALFTGLPPTPTTLQFTPASGIYLIGQSVTITSSLADVKIYYTTDGTPPSSFSYQYGGSSIVTGGDGSTVTIRAVAVADGYGPSAISTSTYIIDSGAKASTSNGNWTAPATWGGTAPVNDGSENIIIQNDITIDGVVVNAKSITVNNGRTLTVLGTNPVNAAQSILINGTVNHDYNGGTPMHKLIFNTNTLEISTTGSINVNGRGVMGGLPTMAGSSPVAVGYGTYNAGPPTEAAGAGHGGKGGDTPNGATGGAAYWDPANPQMGAGGAGNFDAASAGGNGGGLIIITATNYLSCNGSITANGQDGQTTGGGALQGGGGSGGGIKIVAGSVYGTPVTLSARGGNSSTTGVGGAGGGGGGIYIKFSGSCSITSGDVSHGTGFGPGQDGVFTAIFGF